MSQSNSRVHVGIIMDGNGRWAERRGLPRVAGHRAGATVVRRIVEVAAGLGVGTLSLYAFSSDNWKRPLPEVSALLQLFRRYLLDESARLAAADVSLEFFGRRDRLPEPLVAVIDDAERLTAGARGLRLRVAIDYSGRDAIRRAATQWSAAGSTDGDLDAFGRLVAEVDHARGAVPPVDVLIRTGGDQRLSDFLLWEAAYAELFFRRELWPDFRPGDLAEVLHEFRARERRFGGVAPTHLTVIKNA